MNATVAAVMIALVAVLAALGLLLGEEDGTTSSGDEPAEVTTRADVERVARRVERIRGLEFERLPRLERVSAREARAAGLRELDRAVSRDEQENADRLLKLLGLLPAGADLRDTLAEALAGEVGGFYVPRTGRLALVDGAAPGGTLGEVALAHELVHALEDQRFGIQPAGATLMTDRLTAEGGLHEGTATVAMVDYLLVGQGVRFPTAEDREPVLEEIAGVAIPTAGGLPRYVREGLVLPYARGALLVNRILGTGGWAAVDRAFGDRPVRSSEQLIHPEKYLHDERPERVRLPAHRDLLPAGTALLVRGDLGEFDTEQLLRAANGEGRSAAAAAGWGGSAFALWRPDGRGELLAMAWTWDSERDAAEFTAAARRAVARLDVGGAVVRGPARRVAVVLGPQALAARVARRVAAP